MIGRLSGEPKSSFKSVSTKEIIADERATTILEHLDKAYSIDVTDQSYLD